MIKTAVKKPEAFTEYAESHGGMTKEGQIDMQWTKNLAKNKKIPLKIRQRADFAIRMHEIRS